jgi:hypothetical protein
MGIDHETTAYLIWDRIWLMRKKVQLQPHIVYLALSSEVKVARKRRCLHDGLIKVRHRGRFNSGKFQPLFMAV